MHSIKNQSISSGGTARVGVGDRSTSAAGRHSIVLGTGNQRRWYHAIFNKIGGWFSGCCKVKTSKVYPDDAQGEFFQRDGPSSDSCNASISRQSSRSLRYVEASVDFERSFRNAGGIDVSEEQAPAQSDSRSYDAQLTDWVSNASSEENRPKAKRRIEKWISSREENPDRYLPLELNSLGLTELPPLPGNVEILHIEGNKLTNLGELPGNLKELYASGNLLEQLNKLPSSVERVNLSENKITGIRSNLLSELTNFTYLELSGNQLVNVDDIESPNSSCKINLELNPLSQTMREHLARLERLAQANAYEGPEITYSNANNDPVAIRRADSLFGNNDSYIQPDDEIEHLPTAADDTEYSAEDRGLSRQASVDIFDPLRTERDDES